jgi:hypothetical protein
VPETREGKFGLDVRNWVKKAKGNADQVLRATVIGLLNNVVVRSPVGNPDLWESGKGPPGYVGGRFRGSWQVTVGAPADGQVSDIDPAGSATIIKAQATINGVSCGPPVYIVNNLPYAIPLEYGHSKQAPLGMVRLATKEFQRIVNEAARSLPK